MVKDDYRCILIADDEEPIRRLLEYTLKRDGYTTILAADGGEAIQKVDDGLACAVVDLRMPVADGLQVLEYIRQSNPDLPVVMVSAVGQIKDAVNAMKAGAFEYLTKPLDLDALLAVVRQAVGIRKVLADNRNFRSAVDGGGQP